MLLLYLFQKICLFYQHCTLHSTMLLLYLTHYVVFPERGLSLHSTMLLLYLIRARLYKPFMPLYIPLCFYYICRGSRLEAKRDHFTFHYASTISGYHNLLLLTLFPLHSTMLLLYRPGFHKHSSHRPTLHSTMLLLYHRMPQLRRHRYYPLHSTMLLLYLFRLLHASLSETSLHSTMLLLYRRLIFAPFLLCLLYIPLCFYYISESSSESTGNATFTFHYASTISKHCMSFSPFFFVFTFHYASTISKTQGQENWPLGNFTFHYASTISPGVRTIPPGRCLFTFHYASTISQ